MTSIKPKPPKKYIVWKGITPGIYDTWEECKRQVSGVQAVYKSYAGITDEEAERIFQGGPYSPESRYGKKGSSAPLAGAHSSGQTPVQIVPGSWAVDAATSHNPGPMEYRCVDIDTREVVFASKVYPHGTNNIGEFLAIVHAMALMIQRGEYHTIYSDSLNAILWIKGKTCKTKLPRNTETLELFNVIERALAFLHRTDPRLFDLRKWPTEQLGEIPADYGRK